MGCVYIGIRTQKSVHGELKIGMTTAQKPNRRLSRNNIECMYYLYCPGATVAQLMLLESEARCALEEQGLKHHGNDWGSYFIEKGNKIGQGKALAKKILEKVIIAAKRKGIYYEIN